MALSCRHICNEIFKRRIVYSSENKFLHLQKSDSFHINVIILCPCQALYTENKPPLKIIVAHEDPTCEIGN